ncbi:MAG: hypothetical protein B7Z26_08345, partial [Asticcacaulis sp. 32-58-5]
MTFSIGNALGMGFSILSRCALPIIAAACIVYVAPLIAFYYAVELPAAFVDDGSLWRNHDTLITSFSVSPGWGEPSCIVRVLYCLVPHLRKKMKTKAAVAW